MTTTLSFKEADGYLFITVKGPWSLGSVSQAVKDIGKETRKRAHTRILVDARLLDAPTIGLHRFLIGQEVSEHWRGIKAAVVRPADLIDKFGEDAAVNRGAQVKVLADIDDALSWLMCRPSAKLRPTLH
jgi:hypothetical protein